MIKHLFRKQLTAVVIALCATAIAASAKTITVTNTNDSGPGSLRAAVTEANNASTSDEVVFDLGVFGSPQTITLLTPIAISENANTSDTLAIIGPGADRLTISGNNVTRMFTAILGDTTSISGMTLTAGRGAGNGGAIANDSALTVANVVFNGNTATSNGGAISNASSGSMNIVGCTFTDNTATGTNINGDGGGAIYSRNGQVSIRDTTITGSTSKGGGGAIRLAAGVSSITNTTITNCTSGGAGNTTGGGAILNGGELTLTNCTISGNTAGENTQGGAIKNFLKLTINNSKITGNTATEGGGGIYAAGSTESGEFVTINNSTISDNVANTGTGSTTVGNGGGIWTQQAMTLRITGSTISGNSVRSGNGGGIYAIGKVTMANCTVSGNSAGVDGGGIFDAYAGGGNSEIVITGSTIVNNTAGGGSTTGGGIRYANSVGDTPTSIGNTIVANNSPVDLQGTIGSGSYNLIGGNPNLGPLQDNGGLTATHALLPGSPAIDKGKNLSALPTDQRGVTRPTDNSSVPNAQGGDGSDIGAYEVGAGNGVAEKTLGNIATRLPVRTGENVLIGGLIVVGDAPKRLIIRALGPSLAASGVAGTLQDPILEIYRGENLQSSNNNWKDTQELEIRNTGVAPTDDREAAIAAIVQPGSYTAVLRGVGDTTGVGLIEVYDLEQRPDSKLANISSRGFVFTGENVLIGGFIVGPATKVVVRAIGPSLGNGGVAGALQDPTLDLVNANGEVLRTNDNWKGTQRAELEAIGIQPSDDRESALVATLTAGNYTAVVRGVGSNTGVGLVEVYNVQ